MAEEEKEIEEDGFMTEETVGETVGTPVGEPTEDPTEGPTETPTEKWRIHDPREKPPVCNKILRKEPYEQGLLGWPPSPRRSLVPLELASGDHGGSTETTGIRGFLASL